ncbi:MAG: hypothetical protein QXW29_02360 [Thermoplasmatales archaeon]
MRKIVIISLVVFVMSSAIGITPLLLSPDDQSYLYTPQISIPYNPIGSDFAFVSMFSERSNYSSSGWKLISGDQPVVSSSQMFEGQPSLFLSNGSEIASARSFPAGDRLLSFQFIVKIRSGIFVFSIVNSSLKSILSISLGSESLSVISGNEIKRIWIKGDASGSGGWDLIQGTAFENISSGNDSWNLQLFSEGNDVPLTNMSIRNMSSYSGLTAFVLNGSAYLSDVIFTSDPIALYLPGYNFMEGYGQGSGEIAQLLGPFTILHANIILYNWSSTSFGAMSLQINALNYSASLNPTARGFFQVGVDLDPAGSIAPWYVGGNNAVAVYFPNFYNPDFMPGFQSPNGTRLSLSVEYLTAKHLVLMQVIDYSVGRQFEFWNASVQYSGPPFYSAYTQLELSSSASPDGYSGHFLVYNITYGNSLESMQPFSPDYELPYSINAPSNWYISPYNFTVNGYSESI